jgi:hypothetical protein
VTFNDIARRFGVTAPLAASLGRQLVDKGLADPSYVSIRGVQTMWGLSPRPAPVAAVAAAVVTVPSAMPLPPAVVVPAPGPAQGE